MGIHTALDTVQPVLVRRLVREVQLVDPICRGADVVGGIVAQRCHEVPEASTNVRGDAQPTDEGANNQCRLCAAQDLQRALHRGEVVEDLEHLQKQTKICKHARAIFDVSSRTSRAQLN